MYRTPQAAIASRISGKAIPIPEPLLSEPSRVSIAVPAFDPPPLDPPDPPLSFALMRGALASASACVAGPAAPRS